MEPKARSFAVPYRAMWKGFLKFGQVSCGVGLHAGISASDKIAFHTLNRSTGHRVKRQYVDEETGKPVDRDDQVKGYETSKGDYVVLEPEEVAAVVPETDKTLHVEAFIPCSEVDTVFLERPYYLTPTDDVAVNAFSVFREGLRKKSVAAVTRTVLFRRVRSVLVRPHGKGLVASTLHYDYEIRSAKKAFEDVPRIKIEKEMMDLARHIIETKKGKYDPRKVEDRYGAAVAKLVKAKLAGKPIKAEKPRESAKVIDLMDALRQSAGRKSARIPKAKSRKSAKRGRRAGTEKQRKAS
jgi:DNA end-binding protein Ku